MNSGSPSSDNRDSKSNAAQSDAVQSDLIQTNFPQVAGVLAGIRRQSKAALDTKTILLDQEFITALQATTEYEIAQEGCSAKRDLQILLRPESVQSLCPAAERIAVAFWELLEGDYFAESVAEEALHEREKKWLFYLKIAADALQDASEKFKNPMLWKIFDDKIVAQLLPKEERFNSLKSSLAAIRDTTRGVDRSSFVTVFGHLKELAYSIVDGVADHPILTSLAAGFALRGIEFALRDIPQGDINSLTELTAREHLAIDFGATLARELAYYQNTGQSPLFDLLSATGSRGVDFADRVFSGYFNLTATFFTDALRHTRNNRSLIEGLERFGQSACIIWPDSFPAKLFDRFKSFNHYQQASALKIMQHGVSDQPERLQFVVEKALGLFRSSHSFVRERVVEVLGNLAQPCADYLSQSFIAARAVREDSDLYFEEILKSVFMPLVQQGRMTDEIRLALSPYLIRRFEQQKRVTERLVSDFGGLFAPDSLRHTDKLAAEQLLGQALHTFLHKRPTEREITMISPLDRSFASFVTSFGFSGVQIILESATLRLGSEGVLIRRAAAIAAQVLTAHNSDATQFYQWLRASGAPVLTFGIVRPELREPIKPKYRANDFPDFDFSETNQTVSKRSWSDADYQLLRPIDYQSLAQFLNLPGVDDDLRVILLQGNARSARVVYRMQTTPYIQVIILNLSPPE